MAFIGSRIVTRCASLCRMRLLFVCMGNICRSPTAEGTMKHVLLEAGLDSRVEVDSAGTGAWHVGSSADPRSQAAARRRGIDLDSIARQVTHEDLDSFDLILAADTANQRDLLALAGEDPERRAKIRLLREFDQASVETGDLDVPDPYYGGADGFDDVLDLVDAACRGLLAEIRAHPEL
jgi:protein-tyrosine phosphatase